MPRIKERNELLLFKLIELHKTAFNRATKLFNQEGLEVPVDQLPVLMVIYYEGEMPQQAIAEKLVRDKSSVLRSVVSLESKGFVRIHQDDHDKRKKLVSLTVKGETQAGMIAKEIVKVDKILFQSLEVEERKVFEELIEKCKQNIQKG